MIGPQTLGSVSTVAAETAADTPAERRGAGRDSVRLMVGNASTGAIGHTTFRRIGDHLTAGDVLVINVSATIPASIDGHHAKAGRIRLHMSSPVAGGLWTLEPRRRLEVGSQPWPDLDGGVVALPGGAEAELLVRVPGKPRLWIAELRGWGDTVAYLRRHGQPIRYAHVARDWPLSDYQNVYATEPGSAEMPSAGRPFTHELLTSLVAGGVIVAPVVLHSGVASFEAGENPDAEHYRVSETTARVVNQARAAGGRAIAVGTTSVRAIETVTDSAGLVHPGSGMTDLIVTPERGVRGVDGIVSGWHEAGVSHLSLIESIAGKDLVEQCYAAAVSGGYRWHEFGDSLLVIGRTNA